MATRITAEELADRYTDAAWRRSYLEAVGVVTLLRYCILQGNYKISDGMNAAIQLSDYGRRIQHTLTTKHEVPAKEARMMCFLEIAHEEPMIDFTATDFSAIISEISEQILKGTLRYPYMYGAVLYNKAADMFPDLRSQLNSAETSRLLENTPAGVFQVGNIVIGPLGAIRAVENRWLPPTTRLPLQHCGDVSCMVSHVTRLSTDYDAVINQHISKMPKVLGKTDVAEGAWTKFTGILAESDDRPYDDYSLSGLVVALGDCLSHTELRALIAHLGEVGDTADFKVAIRSAGFGEGGIEQLTGADHATLLQLAWLSADAPLLRAVDALVEAGTIKVLPNEVRSPRLAQVEVGRFRLQTEIGRDGVRLAPATADVPILRLERLIASLYDVRSDTDRQELVWQLRGVDGSSIEDRLAEFMRTNEPSQIVSTLVLARRQNLVSALSQLRIDSAGLGQDIERPELTDEDIVRKVLWKIGFDDESLEDATADFWRKHRWMKQFARDAAASSVLDIEMLRNGGGNFFVALEEVLDDSLAFVWWALATDHASAPIPFTYQPSEGLKAWGALDSFWKSQSGVERLQLVDRRTLYPLGQSFAVLCAHLKEVRTQRGDYIRAAEAKPKWAGKTSLRVFPFEHSVPFLDLLPAAQEAILSNLAAVSRALKDGEVHRIRNEISHYQRSSVDLSGLESAVNAAGVAVEALEAMGACRLQYRKTRLESDRWGRSTAVMRSANGNEVRFARPSKYRWAGLPSLSEPQYLVRGALFAPPNEILRFRLGAESDFSRMWADYPRRRSVPRGRFPTQTADASDVARSSHQVLPGQD